MLLFESWTQCTGMWTLQYDKMGDSDVLEKGSPRDSDEEDADG